MPAPDKNILISIITPFLNAEKFLAEAIKSVLAQTYHHWELILIDDGSSDGSTNIAKKYAERFPEKIYYVEHQGHVNLGASTSRNVGFQFSKGDYIAYLDADDVYLPQKLERQEAILSSQPEAAMLYASTIYWYSWEKPHSNNQDFVWKNFGFTPDVLVRPPKLAALFLRDENIPCMGSVLARREAIEKIGGWEDSFRYIYTDQVFHTKMCLSSSVYVSSGCWDKYRQHQDSACYVVERAGQEIAARRDYLLWVKNHLVEQGMDKNAELRTELNKALWKVQHPHLNNWQNNFRKLKYKIKRAIISILGVLI